jgi:WD40 repeat protein
MVCIGEFSVNYQLRKCVYTPIQAGVSCKWAHDSQRFLLEFFDPIQDSPSQIYHFALPLCPSLSWLYNSYTTGLSSKVKVVKGPPAGWGACLRTVLLGDHLHTHAHWKDVIAVALHSGVIVTLDGITGSQVAVLSGHVHSVSSLSFSSDGTFLVSGGEDTTLKLWDVQTGGIVKTFHGHTGRVFSISISSNCTTIASGSSDKTIRLWDIQIGKCHHIIEQKASVDCVSFSPMNPQHLISVSGGVVQWWDVSGCKIKPPYEGSYAAFSLDGTHFALCGGKVTTIQNSDSGVIVAKCPTDIDSTCCCFSPNGRFVAIAADTTAYVWDITSTHPHLIETFIGHTDIINSLTFSSSSSLISASGDESVKFWKIGASSVDLVTSDPGHIPPTSAAIVSVSLQAESDIAISSYQDGVVKTWDISTGLCKASFQTPAKGGSWIDAQMIDGRLVVVWVWKEQIHIWDAKKGELLQVVEGVSNNIWDLRISGDGSKVFLLTGRSIQAWSMWTGEALNEVTVQDKSCVDLLCTGGLRSCLHFSNPLAQGISDSSPVPLPNTSSERPYLDFIGGGWWYDGPSWIKDTVTGKEVYQLSGRYARPHVVQWDGRYLVVGYETEEVLILDFNKMLPQ